MVERTSAPAGRAAGGFFTYDETRSSAHTQDRPESIPNPLKAESDGKVMGRARPERGAKGHERARGACARACMRARELELARE